MTLCYSPTCYFNRLNEDEKDVLRVCLGMKEWVDVCESLMIKNKKLEQEIKELKRTRK